MTLLAWCSNSCVVTSVLPSPIPFMSSREFGSGRRLELHWQDACVHAVRVGLRCALLQFYLLAAIGLELRTTVGEIHGSKPRTQQRAGAPPPPPPPNQAKSRENRRDDAESLHHATGRSPGTYHVAQD